MKRILFAIFTLALFANLAFAQQMAKSYVGPTSNPKSKSSTKRQTGSTRSKGEVYVGYSGTAKPTTTGNIFNDNKKVYNGIETSITANVSRYVGVKGDFSMGYRDQKEGGLTRRTTITNILGGVQLKDNESDAAVQPFAHALVGVANFRQWFREQKCDTTSNGVCSSLTREWGLAGAFGGGFDVRVANRAGIRFGGDYNPMRIKKETINNFRFGVGVVFK